MKYQNFIERNPAVMSGKPVIKGTRLSVELILKKMSEGANIEDLQRAYPSLMREQIYAVLEYASLIIANEETVD